MGNVHIAFGVIDINVIKGPSVGEKSAKMQDFSSVWDSENGPQDVGNGEPNMGIWYTMLDNNGNTVIDDTLIRETMFLFDVGMLDIAVDSEDKVHIVWCDAEYADLFYTKLDPSLDDQDGEGGF